MNNHAVLRQYVDTIEQKVSDGGGVDLTLLDQAFEKITEEVDAGLYGHLQYLKALSLLYTENPSTAIEALNESIRCMMGTSEELMAARSYNVLGVIAHGRNDLILASEYYTKGLAIAKKHNYHYTCNLLYHNIAGIYHRLKAYDKAIIWHEYSLNDPELPTYRNTPLGKSNYMILLSSYGFCLAMLQKMEEAQKLYEEVEQLCDEGYREFFVDSDMSNFYALYFYLKGDNTAFEHYLTLSYDGFLSDSERSTDLDSVLHMFDLLIFTQHYDKLDALTDQILTLATNADNSELVLLILELKIHYCKDLMTPEQYLSYVDQYFPLKEKSDTNNRLQRIHLVEMQTELLQIEENQKNLLEQNLMLQSLAEHDALTGLYNRGKFDKYSEELFAQAQADQLNFGFLFIDIDYFKEINDHYGHEHGDFCIRSVAQNISQSVHGDFAARYGGDEFAVILIGQTEEEVHDKAQRILYSVEKQGIANEGVSEDTILTISVGASYGLPLASHTLKDYLSAADKALYEQKELRRGEVNLIRV